MKNWLNLNHKLYKIIKENSIESSRFLLCVSGGADSVALAHAFRQVLPQHKQSQQLGLFHYHHGRGENYLYRDQALELCQKLASDLDMPFYTEINLQPGRGDESEESYREKRYTSAEKIKSAHGFDLIVTAHHLEDLLETRLIRLVRGVGVQGFESIRPLDNNRFRPFLKVSKKELLEYVEFFRLKLAEDPTNLESNYLRNWIRNHWLVDLENKLEGSVERMARSLELIAEFIGEKNDAMTKNYKSGIQRSWFLSLSGVAKKQEIASYLLWLGVKNFTQGQIEEIIKNLDKTQTEFTFKVAHCEWKVNAEQIWV